VVFKSKNDLAKQLEGKVNVKVIGDSVSPRKVINAVHEGFHTGRLLE
jgi:2-enoate reductase